MSVQENKEIALTVIEALNSRDLSLWSEHLAEDYTAEHPGVSIPLNKTKGVGYYQRFVTAFPDIHFEVLHVLAEGDHVLIHWRGSGTHTERLATLTGETIPPPGARRRCRGRCSPRLGTARSYAFGVTLISSRSWPSWASANSPDSSCLLRASRSADPSPLCS